MEGITPEQLAAVQQQCIFCQIASGKVPAKKVYEDKHVLAILDINPASAGHILLITKKHYFVMPQIPENEVEHIGKIAKQLSQILLKALKVEGTSIFIANGVAAGQKAQHFMLHIIPRKQGDNIELTIPQRQVSEEDFNKIHKALIEGVEKHLGKITGLEKENEKKNQKRKKKLQKQKNKPKKRQKKQKLLKKKKPALMILQKY